MNEYIDAERTNRFKAAGLKRKAQREIKAYAMQAIRKGTLHRHENTCELLIKWVEPNNRRDADNISFGTKFLQDALVEIGVFPDDSRKYIDELHHTFETDKENPRIEVTIRER